MISFSLRYNGNDVSYNCFYQLQGLDTLYYIGHGKLWTIQGTDVCKHSNIDIFHVMSSTTEQPYIDIRISSSVLGIGLFILLTAIVLLSCAYCQVQRARRLKYRARVSELNDIHIHNASAQPLDREENIKGDQSLDLLATHSQQVHNLKAQCSSLEYNYATDARLGLLRNIALNSRDIKDSKLGRHSDHHGGQSCEKGVREQLGNSRYAKIASSDTVISRHVTERVDRPNSLPSINDKVRKNSKAGTHRPVLSADDIWNSIRSQVTDKLSQPLEASSYNVTAHDMFDFFRQRKGQTVRNQNRQKVANVGTCTTPSKYSLNPKGLERARSKISASDQPPPIRAWSSDTKVSTNIADRPHTPSKGAVKEATEDGLKSSVETNGARLSDIPSEDSSVQSGVSNYISTARSSKMSAGTDTTDYHHYLALLKKQARKRRLSIRTSSRRLKGIANLAIALSRLSNKVKPSAQTILEVSTEQSQSSFPDSSRPVATLVGMQSLEPANPKLSMQMLTGNQAGAKYREQMKFDLTEELADMFLSPKRDNQRRESKSLDRCRKDKPCDLKLSKSQGATVASDQPLILPSGSPEDEVAPGHRSNVSPKRLTEMRDGKADTPPTDDHPPILVVTAASTSVIGANKSPEGVSKADNK